MFERQGKVGYALRLGALLLCLGLVSGQTQALEHLHLDADGSSACVVCAHGDAPPLGDLGLDAAPPYFVENRTYQAAGPRASIKRRAAPYTSRAPPFSS